MSEDDNYESVDDKFNIVKQENSSVYYTPNEIENGVKIKKENIKQDDVIGDPKFSKNIRPKPKGIK